MSDEAWPTVLLALRVGVVIVLYLFLLSGFRALRAELRAPSFQIAPSPGPVDFDVTEDFEPFDEPTIALPQSPRPKVPRRIKPASHGRARPWKRVPLALGIPAVAAAVVVLGAGVALATRDDNAGGQGAVATVAADQAFGPPAVKPASGRVTVGLAATEDALVRVTVDGVVQFDGTLRARQRQAWEGSQRVQVWTDKGKTLQIAINGDNLGAYSPAMGHPDWNRIDFGFIPGWTRANGVGG